MGFYTFKEETKAAELILANLEDIFTRLVALTREDLVLTEDEMNDGPPVTFDDLEEIPL